MKKILTHLTVIVFLVTILLAAGCDRSTKQKSSPELIDDSNQVEVFLKDTMIDGRMHIEMHNEKHKDKKIIDSLETVVHRGDKVIFKKADGSDIWKIYDMRVVEGYANIFTGADSVDRGLYKLEINPDAPFDTIVKYEIVFAVKKGDDKETTWCIDPYLRIPRQ